MLDRDWNMPALRGDLKFFDGPRDWDNTPTWTLHDPVRNRFFRLGWLDHILLTHWQPGRLGEFIDTIDHELGIRVTLQQLNEIISFLYLNNLLKSNTTQSVQSLVHQYYAQQQGFFRGLMVHYLFFKIHLIRPDPILRFLLPRLNFIYTRSFLLVLGLLGILGIYLTARQWDAFGATVQYFFSLNGVVWYAATLVAIKLFHELGHALTAYRLGCRIPSMGVAFMVLWPILYTDTSEAWKLRSRRARIAIGAAGVGAELVIAVLATLVWNFLPEGPARSSAVLLATVTWITSLIINLNPLMRFDGYYLLSDLLGMDNLQDRAFALARWRLRETLWAFGESPPEVFSAKHERIILIYAYATWIYRFLLFIGIAFLVYHMVFKLAGIVLMLVEIIWFVSRPVWRELREWWIRRATMVWNRHSVLTVLGISGVIGFVFIPWQKDLEVPALVSAQHHIRLYAPVASRVVHVSVAKYQTVTAGELLLMLEAPDLEESIAQTTARIEALQWEIDHAASQPSVLENNTVLQKERVALLTERQGYQERIARLRITAPFTGIVTDMEQGLIPGRWLTPTTHLIELLDPQTLRVEAFVSETEIKRIIPDTQGTFEANDRDILPFAVRLSEIDHTALASLPKPYLAALYGGPIVVWQDKKNQLIPYNAIYRLTLDIVDHSQQISYEIPGKIKIPAENKSYIQSIINTILSVIIRESGF